MEGNERKDWGLELLSLQATIVRCAECQHSVNRRLSQLEAEFEAAEVLSSSIDQFVKYSAFDMLGERLKKVEKATEELSAAARPQGRHHLEVDPQPERRSHAYRVSGVNVHEAEQLSMSDNECDHIEALHSEEEKAAAAVETGSLEEDIEVKDPSQWELPETVEISPPEDVHYLSAFMTLQDEQLDSRVGYACVALIIVLLQLCAPISLIVTMGNQNGLCYEHGECGRAKWCTATAHPRSNGAGAGRCLFCVSDENDLCSPDGTAKNEVLWATEQASFRLATRSALPRGIGYHLGEEDHHAMCSYCIGEAGLTRGIPTDIVNFNLLMGVRQWMVYIFIIITASVLISSEASDWYKNLIILHRAQPKHWLSALNSDGTTDAHRGQGFLLLHQPKMLVQEFHCQHIIWKIKYLGLQAVQDLRAGTLCTILTNVPCFLMLDLSDPVSILMNAIATFFVLEVDDLFFNLHPAENHPVRAWTSQPIRITLEDANRIQKVKLMFFLTSMFVLIMMKPLGAVLGIAYLYIPAVLLNACALISELMLCHTWYGGCKVTLRWFMFGFGAYWLINIFFISWLPVDW